MIKVIINNFCIFKLVTKTSPLRFPLEILTICIKLFETYYVCILLWRWILDTIFYVHDFSATAFLIMQYCILRCACSILTSVVDQYFIPTNNTKVNKTFQEEIMSKASRIEIKYYEDKQFFDNYFYLLYKMPNIVLDAWRNITNFVYSLALIIIFTIISFQYSAIVIICVLLQGIFQIFLSKKINDRNFTYNVATMPINKKDDYYHRLFYLVDYAKELRVYGARKFFIKKYLSVVDERVSVIKEYGFKLFVLRVFENFNSSMIFFTAIIIIILLTNNNIVLTVGIVFMLHGMFNEMSDSTMGLVNNLSQFHQNSQYISIYNDFMDIENEDKIKGITVNNIEFFEYDNVSFSYNKDSYALKNVCLKIYANETIAITGENGSGKSTLLKLLLRFYHPDSGYIKLNGIPVNEYNMRSYRDAFGAVFQDYNIYSFDISDNVLLGNSSVVDDVIVSDSLKTVGLYRKVSQFPNGVHTQLTNEFDNDGISLSGGENQKLSIARVIASNRKVLVLDEPSSALDPISESEILQQIYSLSKEKTTFIISHKLSTTINADRIIYLEKGEIAEIGTHKELMRKKGKYYSMFKIQSDSYLD